MSTNRPVHSRPTFAFFLLPQLGEHFFTWEWLYSRVLKSKVPQYVEPDALQKGFDQELIVVYHYSSLDRIANAQQRKIMSRFRPEVIIHASDEKLRHKSSNYRHAKIVIRQYFNPNLWKRRTFFIPIGYNESIVRHISVGPAERVRLYAWSFFGNLKGDRDQMLGVFEKIRPNRASTSQTGMLGPGLPLTDEEVADLLVNSHFVLCPFGSLSPDTWRVMEALEAGAIPVSVKMRGLDYFTFVFGDHPFVVSDSWDDAARDVANVLSDPALLAAKHAQVASWYEEFTERLSRDILAIVFEDRVRTVSEQFTYQRRARWNLRIRWAFWMHFSQPRAVRKIRHVLEKSPWLDKSLRGIKLQLTRFAGFCRARLKVRPASRRG